MTAAASPFIACVGPFRQLPADLPGVVTSHAHSDDFLLSEEAYLASTYLLAARQDGVPTPDLVRLLRRRTLAPVLVLGVTEPDEAAALLDLGADAVIAAAEHAGVTLSTLAAVQRRSAAAPAMPWRLSMRHGQLLPPQGEAIALSDGEQTLLRVLAEAGGTAVHRDTLSQALWGADGAGSAGALHAALYRLRKRIEGTGVPLDPIQAVGRQGYAFREPIRLED